VLGFPPAHDNEAATKRHSKHKEMILGILMITLLDKMRYAPRAFRGYAVHQAKAIPPDE
jgi:hypothetical protein